MKTWTWSCWLKRSKLGSRQSASISGSLDGNNEQVLWFLADDTLKFNETADGVIANVTTNRKFRDTNAWYHIVVAYDTTQSTASDRIKIYVNGTQETSLSATTYPSQNHNGRINNNVLHHIGRTSSSHPNYFDGQMAHVHYSDGQSYAPTTFGETDSTTGIWKPKTSPTGINYGTNGFFLKMDNSGNMGLDSSGQSNNLTTSGTIIQTKDTPSNNFATGNPLIKGTNGNSNVNNTSTSGQNSWESMWTTLGASSGKWYAEFKRNSSSYTMFGVRKTENITTFDEITGATGGVGWQSHGSIYNNNSETESGGSPYATYADGDIIGVAMDLDNSKLYFHKNGTYQNSGVPTSGSTGTGAISLTANAIYHFGFCAYNGSCDANFGNGYFGTTAITSAGSNGNGSLFEYDVPTGYYALNTKNIGTQS
jgi:hypothetical protein